MPQQHPGTREAHDALDASAHHRLVAVHSAVDASRFVFPERAPIESRLSVCQQFSALRTERLAVLPHRQPLHNSSELLRGDRMAELVGFLEAETPKRVIVYDMPPALVGDDVLAFSDSVDSIMMVVAEGKTSRVALENARNVLGDMNLLGVVLNHASQSKDEAYAYY